MKTIFYLLMNNVRPNLEIERKKKLYLKMKNKMIIDNSHL